MRKESLVLILLFLGWLITGAFICKKYICGLSPAAPVTEVIKQVAPAAAVTPPPAITRAEPYKLGAWNIADGRNFGTKSNDHFRFKASNAPYIAPTASLEKSVKSTADYLKKNKNRSIDITGYYRTPEKNSSVFSNLGLARADKVQKMLLGLGVASTQINTKGVKLPDERWFANNTIDKGIEFGFSELKTNDPRLTGIKNRLFGKPVTMYFQTNSENIDLNVQQRQDLTDLVYYLDRVPTAKLEIGGHTDNVGQRASNVSLSKGRADFAAKYLTQRGGIAANRMVMQGFGPDKPVADNGTAEGKQKNRRVEVILK